MSVITSDVVAKVAKLARLIIPSEKSDLFAAQIEPILEHFDSLNKVNVDGVEPTYQVTGQKNRLREDIVDTKRMFTQAQALANAPKSQNGYFVTKATISKK